jgi:hypothetical protein
MLPAGAHKMIRSVRIHYYANDFIQGFSFFDKEGALLWKIGGIASWMDFETVLVGESEAIVGVVAKLNPVSQSIYTDFSFQIAGS